MLVYRISKQQYINDLSGFGAAHFPGRWNSKGVYLLYTAATASLSLLESVVHISTLADMQYSIACIFLPDNSMETILVDELPADWHTHPPPDALKMYGDNFVKKQQNLILKVPSSIMPEDYNYLINPAHPAFTKVKIESVRVLQIDDRLIKS